LFFSPEVSDLFNYEPFALVIRDRFDGFSNLVAEEAYERLLIGLAKRIPDNSNQVRAWIEMGISDARKLIRKDPHEINSALDVRSIRLEVTRDSYHLVSTFRI
jgi:hypothetical protein